MTKLLVHSRQVEVLLACQLWLVFFDPEVNNNKASQPEMVEKQIQIVVLPSELEVVLAAYEGEALAELRDSGAKML